MISVSARYAWRSLRRNLRRTLLSLFGIAFGVGIGLMAISWVRGLEAMFVDAAAGGGIGHLRVAPEGWRERRSDELRLPEWREVLERARGTEGVEVATPRAAVGGLLGLGTRSAHVRLTGVDAVSEPRALRYVREVDEGRYLRRGERNAIVIGRAIADRLGAELEDELVVTVVDDEGRCRARSLVVVGIVRTGTRAIDASIAHVALEDIEQLSGREGAADVTIRLSDVGDLEAARASLARDLPGGEVLTWMDVAPELRANLESRGAFMTLTIVIVLFVVLLGVASAQLTGVLERRKELAVLAALGTRGAQLVRVVLTEGVILGALGGLGALAWAAPLLHRWSEDGLDMTKMIESRDEGTAFAGVLFDPVFHPDFGAWAVPAAFALSLIATVAASIYPAWFASRTDPASALRADR
ncbi:MAG: ABC transporter permease [Sandaracinaceae bacterium]|nr:ABC transporter permease [Sandaracinaceae bacterium]